MWKQIERPEFEVTTEEVLRKADFRVSIGSVIMILYNVSKLVLGRNLIVSLMCNQEVLPLTGSEHEGRDNIVLCILFVPMFMITYELITLFFVA